MEKRELLYEGKAKQVFLTDDPDCIIIHYKDDATAYNNVKKAIIEAKGLINNQISAIVFEYLGKNGIPTHFIKQKNDELGDPLINNDHAVALGVVTYGELDEIFAIARKVNELLTDLFKKHGITLVDFKMEFGRTSDGQIVLADEISPDTCRFWDSETNEKLDKDRFRRDLGKVREAYEEILHRLTK